MNRKEATSLLISGLAITGGVLSASFTGGLTLISPDVVNEGLKAFGGLGGNLVANAIQAKLIDAHPQEDVLKNGDLTRAIGSAIFKICGKIARETSDENDKEALLTLSQTDLEVWENLIIGGEYQEGYGLVLNDIDLEELSAEKSVQYFSAKAENLDQIKSLTPQIWQNIIASLCNKIETFDRGKRCSLSKSSKEELANNLHSGFATALRKVLIADFAKDGKAFASMQFRILGEILYYTEQNFLTIKETHKLSDSIHLIVTELSKKVDEINRNSPKNYSSENKDSWNQIFGKFETLTKDISEIRKIAEAHLEVGKEQLEAEKEQLEVGKEHLELDKQQFNLSKEQYELLKKIFDSISDQPKSSKQKPLGLINLPREKNDYFVEQSNVFERLDSELAEHHLAYLHGTHGLGKTTTLNEYAYAREGNYDFIFYVLATDSAIEGELARFADEFLEDIADTATPSEKALKVIKYLEENARWEKKSKNWLVIFDNLETPKWIETHFPKTSKGDCLYACNKKMYFTNDREVEFEQFSQEEAELFLYKKVNGEVEAGHENISSDELEGIRAVIEQVGKIPLALNIAGYYIKETQVSYVEYVELIKANIKKHLNFKGQHGQHQSETAFDAFSVSLDKIKEFDPDDEDGEIVAKLAETFLDLCSFCAPEDIPEELVGIALFELIDITSSSTPPKILFRLAVSLLKKFDLINERQKTFRYKYEFDQPKIQADNTILHWEFRETEINVFDTYRTLQNILSIRLNEESKKKLLEQLILTFSSILPSQESSHMTEGIKFTELEIYEKYVATAYFITQNAENHKIYTFDSLRVSNEIGNYLSMTGQYQKSVYFLERAKIIVENLFQEDHAAIPTVYGNLAGLYEELGNYEKAEPLYRNAVDISERVHGKDHFDTATCYNNLARFLWRKSRLEEAESYYLKVKNILEKVAPKHPNMAMTYNNLAALYNSQEKYPEAEDYHWRSLNLHKEIFGESDPDTALSYSNLAIHYARREEYEKAEPLYKKAIQLREQLSSDIHPDAAKTYISLATLYLNLKQPDEAEPLLKKALEINRKIFGQNHLQTNSTEEYLAELYFAVRRFEEAEPHFKNIRSFYEKESNNAVAAALISDKLAAIYWLWERFDEAINLFKRSLEVYVSGLGESHPQIIASQDNLARLYFERGRFEEAEPLYKKIISHKESDENHLSIAFYYNQLALVYKSLREYEDAENYLKKVKVIYQNEYGESNEDIVIMDIRLAEIFQEQEKYVDAEGLYEKAIKFYEDQTLAESPWLPVLYNSLAKNYREQGKYEQAEPLYKKSIEIYENSLGENDINTAIVRAGFSRLLFKQGKIKESLDLNQLSLNIIKQTLPADHPTVSIVEKWNKEIKEKMEIDGK